MIDRPTAIADDDGYLTPHAEGGAWAKSHPKLTEWMILGCWADKERRDGAYLSIHAADGTWTLCLKDFNLGLELSVATERPEQLLAALEGLLGGPKPPWRQIPGFTPRKKGRRK